MCSTELRWVCRRWSICRQRYDRSNTGLCQKDLRRVRGFSLSIRPIGEGCRDLCSGLMKVSNAQVSRGS